MTMQSKSSAIAAAIAVTGLALAPVLANAQTMHGEHEVNSIYYVSGGSTPGDAAAMQRSAAGYNAVIAFHDTAHMPYGLDGVKVRIKDNRGFTVLDTTARGSVMLLDIPTGNYTVIADYNGRVSYHDLDVADGVRDRITFAWAA
jgi:hypothetical protein